MTGVGLAIDLQNEVPRPVFIFVKSIWENTSNPNSISLNSMYGKQYIRPENIHDLNYSEVLNMVDEGLYQLEFRSPSQDSGAIQQGLMIWSPSDNRKEKPPESALEIALQALFSMNLEIGAFVGLFGRPNENTVQIRSDNPNVLREYPTSYEFDKQLQVMVRWTSCKETVTANRYMIHRKWFTSTE